jgi:(p)ppGpp synthase/HD superfamily hydrolase
MPAEQQVEQAIALASRYHKGQRDKNREPYILHPLTVMFLVKDYVPEDEPDMYRDARTVAVLHDIIEDTSLTAVGLAYFGFPPHIVEAVKTLTRKQNGETYMEYIAEVGKSRLASYVKLADLAHNQRKGCTNSMAARYQKATRYLKERVQVMEKEEKNKGEDIDGERIHETGTGTHVEAATGGTV